MSFKIGPYTISRGALTPYTEDEESDQIRQKDGDGGVVVTGVPYKDSYFRALIRVQRNEAIAIGGYLANNCKFAALPLTLVDGNGITRLVRFWDKRIRKKYLAGGMVEMDLLFRAEV